VISPSQNIYYRDYIANVSQYIFVGAQPEDGLTAKTGIIANAIIMVLDLAPQV